jgi:DNA-binding transcriptional regulator YiaG
LAFDTHASRQINAALRVHLHLLSPEEIQANRQRLGLTEQQLGDVLGVGARAVWDWENDMVVHSREQDNRLRATFGLPSAPVPPVPVEANPQPGSAALE